MQPVTPGQPVIRVHQAADPAIAVGGQPPAKMNRNEKVRERTYTAGPKLLLSLIVLAPRLAIGAAYLTSATVKGILAAFAFTSAKSGVYRGKTDTVKDFAGASFKDARRDFSKAILLAVAGILAPLGHLHAVWDEHENDGRPSEWTHSNWGSGGYGPKFYVRLAGTTFQDIVNGQYESPNSKPHTWKKIEGKLDAVADFVTHYRGIHKAMNKFREKVHMPLRPPTSKGGGP
ncbi:MAG: hypothetical protein LLG04_09445 [Parachlamydia sp.]|nr:hypothetical protein [Parachlamydia sp.]